MMKNKTNIRILGLSVAAALIVINGQALAAETMTLKLGHVQPQSHIFHKGAVKFGETLEGASDGQMKLEIYSDGVMGSERSLLESLQIGSIDLVTVTSALTSTFSQDYALFSLPFLFDSYEDVFRVMDDKAIADALSQDLISKGIRPLAYWIGGARSYYGTGPVGSLGDFKGMKIRTMEDPYYVKTWESLGAMPTPLPFGEVYTAMQTKLVDGAEGAINTYVAKKFYEVASNVAVINYVYSVQPLHISEMTWNKLNEEQQGWVREAAQASAVYERKLLLEVDKALQETLAVHKVEVTHPDIEPLREAVEPVYEDFREEYGDDVYKMVEKIRGQ